MRSGTRGQVWGRRVAAVAGGCCDHRDGRTHGIVFQGRAEGARDVDHHHDDHHDDNGSAGRPTEKSPRLEPGGPNLFSPSVMAPPAPTAVPGDN